MKKKEWGTIWGICSSSSLWISVFLLRYKGILPEVQNSATYPPPAPQVLKIDQAKRSSQSISPSGSLTFLVRLLWGSKSGEEILSWLEKSQGINVKPV